MFVSHSALRSGHRYSRVCTDGQRAKQQRLANEASRQADETVFSIGGTPLVNVSTFKYLGRPVMSNDSDWHAVYQNLKKARLKWGMLSKILARQEASPRVAGLFYKAVVQAVLLYGSESWVITDTILQMLTGFHHRIARRISALIPRRTQNGWVYPPIEEALESAGLYTMEHYLQVRRNRVADYVASRPINELIREDVAPFPGTNPRNWWWSNVVT